MSQRETVYVMIDIERNGGSFANSSILSFAAVAVDTDGNKVAEWYKKFEEREGCDGDADTHAWWLAYPEQYAEAVLNPEDIKTCVSLFVRWIKDLEANFRLVWACQPVAADWPWLKFYVDTFHDTDEPYVLPHKVWDVSTLRIGFMSHFDIDRKQFDVGARKWCQNIDGEAHDPRYDAYIQARVFAKMVALMGVVV